MEITETDRDLTALAVPKGVMTLVDEQRQTELIDYLQDHLVASKRASGGSVADSVIAASYFGCNTFYSCKVALGANGRVYLNDFAAAGVSTAGLRPTQGITVICLGTRTRDAGRR